MYCVLKRIVSGVLLDILPHASGFLFAEMTLEGGNEKVSFYSYEQDREESFPITAKTYLTHKFGDHYKKIIEEIGDFISCDAAPLGQNAIVILFESGQMYIFGETGNLLWEGKVSYRDLPVRDLAVNNKEIWCTVPDCNAVICYSPVEKRVTLRIGGPESPAFDEPIGISKGDEHFYIASRKAKKVRSIRISDYEVKDYCKFKEPVHKFFKVGKYEYAVLDSGIYAL